mmetsp:Transcript_26381/g.38705  ORF Transcript_26381/g.38705 Transcript_26381/m.38705 type:complete len:85 (+) Transcript_26381:363-617(+)
MNPKRDALISKGVQSTSKGDGNKWYGEEDINYFSRIENQLFSETRGTMMTISIRDHKNRILKSPFELGPRGKGTSFTASWSARV